MTATIIDPEAAAAEVARAREILEKPMSEPMGVGELREKVARIIRDPGLGYNIELVRMVDGIATYLADVDGDGPREFPSYAEALTHVQDFSALHKADAILSLLPTGVDGGGSEEEQEVSSAQSQPCAEAGTHIPPSPYAPFSAGPIRRFRHVKRRSCYTLAFGDAEAMAQCAEPIQDGDVLTVYFGDDGMIFARPTHEFHDGRFEALSASPASPDTDPLRATTESGESES